MSENLKNRIKAYLIRMDIQAEEDVKAAETAYFRAPCSFAAARLLGAQHHQQSVHKLLADMWAILDYTF